MIKLHIQLNSSECVDKIFKAFNNGELDRLGVVDIEICEDSKPESWKDMFPKGRQIYYDGNDPESFRQEILTNFGFDVAKDNEDWGLLIDKSMEHIGDGNYITYQLSEEDKFLLYSFHCPPEHLDAIYGSGKYPVED